MSYQPHQANGSGQSHRQSSVAESDPPRVSSQPGQSPIDWANLMNFQTPPILSNNSQSGIRQGGYGGNGSQGQEFHQYPPPSPQNFQQSYPQPPRPIQQGQYVPPSPRQQQLQIPPNALTSRSPSNMPRSPGETPQIQSQNSKGKSPVRQRPEDANRIPSGSGGDFREATDDKGLTLDPAAFSRDIRFQVPPFLSNQVGGAPAFPPGGEAWSGFSGANFFGDGSGQTLTPGGMFGSVFGLNSDTQQTAGNKQSGGGRNVMDGVSGYMNNEGAWDQWGGGKDAMTGMSPAQATTFYVNPNPTQSRLGVPSVNTNMGQAPRDNHMSQSDAQRLRPLSAQHPGHSMPTSTLLPQPSMYGQSAEGNFSFTPSISQPNIQQTSTINIASSSTQPYAPPSNTHALLSGPALPLVGPSLADGPGLYSTTGFDMVGVLSRVAARKEPKTVLGPVDLSCSFLVVDVRRFDSPIVYASPTFTALTGYELPQILGRNCRFLQGPDGEVVKGSKRKYTDNVAVAHLKRMINAGKECQASLINYRRGGIPFINLVTVVPIPWEGTDIVYHVGFQVDLVEQPNAILRNMRDGSYQVNYTVANPPQAPLRPPGRDIGSSGLSQEVLDIMGPRIHSTSFGIGEDGGKMEWLKMVLENADDFVHVLSLKGLFQYVSPSVRRVLEYEPEDLLNKNISDICHPSDIVPLMRELKDSTHAPIDGQTARMVNLVFRIRRKSSGYVWIECTGRLHVEPGKGRKAVILSGRARNVPNMPWDCVAKQGGLAENEFWAKISHQGLILHATSTVNDLLGQPSDDLIGHSIFSLLPGGDNGVPSTALLQSEPGSDLAMVASALRSASQGDTSRSAISVRHKMIKRSGATVDVFTVFYVNRLGVDLPSHDSDNSPDSDDTSPSDLSSGVVSGVRPTCLVVQVKLIFNPAQLGTASTSIADATNARPVVHAPSGNVFEELETTRGTSWQYELHQLRLLNRRLKEDIAAAKAKGGPLGRLKAKKRKFEISMPPPPPPLPEHFSAAPRHQMAPGFGLLASNLSSSYY